MTAVINPVAPDPVALGTSATLIYSPTAGAMLINGIVRLTNTTAGTLKATLHGIPNGGSAADGNAHLKAFPIAANDYRDIAIGNMEPGSSLSGLGDAAGITARLLSGQEYTA